MTELLIPFGTRIVVKPEGGETRTAAGLHIPDVAQETPQRGEVTEISDDATLPVDAGDTVLFSKYAGLKTEINGDDVYVLQEADVLGKIVEVV